MNKDDIYHMLAAYHLAHNVVSIQELQYTIAADGKTEQKGTSNHPINGALILANGASLLERLATRKYFKPSQLSEEISIATPQLFMDALKTYLSYDGAIVIDSKAETMRHVSRILPPSNELDRFGEYVQSRLPIDFRVLGATRQPTEREIGTRTLCALEVPMLEDGVESFMINQTAYGKLGVGKVARFNAQGLVSEIYIGGSKFHPIPLERTYEHGPKQEPSVRVYRSPVLERIAA